MSDCASPYQHPQGYSIDSVERREESLEFVFYRHDGARRPVRSVDRALLRQLNARIIVMNLSLR